MTFDPVRDEIVTFGGYHYTGPVTDETWAFRGGRWSQLHPAHVPPARDLAVLVFDAARKVAVMYGGRDVPASAAAGTGGEAGQITFSADTWTWDGADWTEQHPAHHPVLFVPLGTFDYIRNQVVLLGFSGQEETWTFDGVDWTQHSTANGKPAPARLQGWLAFDAASKSVLTFLGHNDGGADLSAVWEWDGRTWKQVASKAPPVYYLGAMAPDVDRASTLLYDDSGVGPASTWRWTGSGFQLLHPPREPVMPGAVMVPDPPRHRLLLFGWTWPQTEFQMWSWSGQDWSRLTS